MRTQRWQLFVGETPVPMNYVSTHASFAEAEKARLAFDKEHHKTYTKGGVWMYAGVRIHPDDMPEAVIHRLTRERDDLVAALRDTLAAFRICIGAEAFAEFEESNAAVIAARAALARIDTQVKP